jgi:hypothetical protein
MELPASLRWFWVLAFTLFIHGGCVTKKEVQSKSKFWQNAAEDVISFLDKAWEKSYLENDGIGADQLVQDCYFARFEPPERNMEAAIKRYISNKRAALIEDAFLQLRRDLKAQGPAALAKNKLDRLKAMLLNDAKRLDSMGIQATKLRGG